MRLLVIAALVVGANPYAGSHWIPPTHVGGGVDSPLTNQYSQFQPPPVVTPPADTEDLYAKAAEPISKRPTTVKCHTVEEWPTLGHPEAAAFARVTAGEIHLSADICARLRIRDYWGVEILAHEAWHLAGVMDEAATDCYAHQTVATVGRALGMDTAAADELQALNRARTDPVYYSPECREGGQLDLRPDDSRFP